MTVKEVLLRIIEKRLHHISNEQYEFQKELNDAIINFFVIKDGDKVLSDNNYTDEEKNKVANIGSESDISQLILDVDELEHKELAETCGQPRILFGAGTPQESIVPKNWNQYDKDEDSGFNWNGQPVFEGQQYINTTATTGGRYIAVMDSNYGLSWKNF